MTKQDIYDKKVEILKKWEKAIIYEHVHNERCIAKKAEQILAELEAVGKEAKARGLVNQWIDEGRKNNNE